MPAAELNDLLLGNIDSHTSHIRPTTPSAPFNTEARRLFSRSLNGSFCDTLARASARPLTCHVICIYRLYNYRLCARNGHARNEVTPRICDRTGGRPPPVRASAAPQTGNALAIAAG